VRIVIVTQEEPFYIPILLRNLLNRQQNIDGIILLPDLPHGFTRLSYFKRLFDVFGPIDFLKFGILYVHYKLADAIAVVWVLNRYYSVESTAKKWNIPLYILKDINSQEALRILKMLEPDILISVAASQIFKKDAIRSSKHTINIHAALLPHNKGMMPSFWALANGETETGITVHYVDEDIDAGDILFQRAFEISPDDTLHSLQTKVAHFGSDALIEVITMLENGKMETRKPQGEESYFSFPTKAAAQAFRARGRRFI